MVQQKVRLCADITVGICGAVVQDWLSGNLHVIWA